MQTKLATFSLNTKIQQAFDVLYNRAFRLVETPQDAVLPPAVWKPGTVSIVTPENEPAWSQWPALSPDEVRVWVARGILLDMAAHKTWQIIRSAASFGVNIL
jgi:hypothetical protein